MRKFEETELTKLIVKALDLMANEGRVVVETELTTRAFGPGKHRLLMSYDKKVVAECRELADKIRNEKLDVSLYPRD